MPIKGMTDRGPEFPEIGQLRKGSKKQVKQGPNGQYETWGKDLDHFRFTSDIPEVEAAFEAAYDGQPRLINVFLPFRSVDENFDAWQEEYVAGGLVHRCDGETMVLWLDKEGEYHTEPRPCPYATGQKARTTRVPGCTPTGRLKVVVRELRRLAYVTVLTNSKNDIINLSRQLQALYRIQGDLRGIPLQLRRQLDNISTPGEGGKRIRRDKWLLSIEAAPNWVDLQLAAQEAAAAPQITHTPTAIPATVGEIVGGPGRDTAPDDDDDDIPDGEYTEAPADPEPPKQQPKPKAKAAPKQQQASGNGGGYGPNDIKKRLDALLVELRDNVGYYRDTSHLFGTMKQLRGADFGWPPPQNDDEWAGIVQALADHATGQAEGQPAQEGLPL